MPKYPVKAAEEAPCMVILKMRRESVRVSRTQGTLLCVGSELESESETTTIRHAEEGRVPLPSLIPGCSTKRKRKSQKRTLKISRKHYFRLIFC